MNEIAVVPPMWENKVVLDEIKKIYGKDLTEGEFAVFRAIGKSTGLSPYLKEIWAVKYGNNPAQIFVGRDGYRKGAQANNQYEYHQVDAVYSKDVFKMDHGEVEHTYSLIDRGVIAGAYCIVKRKNAQKCIFVFVDVKEYDTGKNLWVSKKATMIKKVAEAQGLRMAFQELFAGTYDEDEVNTGGVNLSDRMEKLEGMKKMIQLCESKEKFQDIAKVLQENPDAFWESELDQLREIAAEKMKSFTVEGEVISSYIIKK